MMMNSSRKLLLLLAAVVLAGMAAPCQAASTRGEIFLDSDVITVGDVFDGVGDKAGAVIANAPEPGRKVTYDVSALAQIARNNALDWKPGNTYERVTITRASQKITAAQIQARVATELAALNPDKELDIALDNQGMEINRPAKEVFTTELTDLSNDPIRHRFSAKFVVKGDKQDKAEVFQISGRAMPMVKVAMLTHAVQMGDVLTASDINWVSVPMDKAGADAISDEKQVQAMEMRRPMNSDSVLRVRDLVKEKMVTKGSLVTMIVETSAMKLSAQGRALGDGAMGDTIRITNTQSNRTVDAVITGRDKVSVTPVMLKDDKVAAAQ